MVGVTLVARREVNDESLGTVGSICLNIRKPGKSNEGIFGVSISRVFFSTSV